MYARAGGSIPYGTPIYFDGPNPATLQVIQGIVPEPNYKDFTKYSSGADKIRLTWTETRDSQGNETTGASQTRRTASNNITFEDEAYRFIREWMVEHPAASINTIDVKIEDTSSGYYEDWIIESDKISWCEDGRNTCEYSVTLNQKNPAYTCIQQTVLSDNHKGWFNQVPANGKKHPRFVYCNEVKPNGMMITLWWLMSVVLTLLFLLTPVINTVIAIIGVIMSIIDAISWLFGGNPDFSDNFNWFDPSDLAESFFLESSGCGRVHPAPLIRDYIDNVCEKCKIKVDGITDPIFHAETITIDASSGLKENVPNPYYNACFMNAPVKRGIRIFRGLFNNTPNETDYYIPENRPIIAFDVFLDQLKAMFNADWRVAKFNGEDYLYFWRKDKFAINQRIYDFTEGSSDSLKILQGVCFSWQDIKHPAFMRGLYESDASDSAGNEAMSYMNTLLSVASTENNPNYNGELDKTARTFGATRFRLDGATPDYLANAMQVLLNGAAINPTIPAVLNLAIVPAIERYADYALLLSEETCQLGKIIIWNPESGYEYSKSQIYHSTYDPNVNGAPLEMPLTNNFYNGDGRQWYEYNMPDTYVTGSTLSFGNYPTGKYTVQEYFGIDFYAKPAMLVNYPMFFRPEFQDNLFDWFHWIDDPRINPKINLNWNVKIELCREDLEGLGVLNSDANDVKVGGKVLLSIGEGRIKEISVSYDSEQETGKYIEIKGTL